jgi:uncharacterized protein (DUF1800 family)
LLSTRRPLQERMVLFWHNHFATSASKVNRAELMLAQNETFRRLALGSFREMLLAVSRDPAMLLWLDNYLNRKGKPNENYARELLELFTLGIGNYTEQDVKEAARAFTGWTLRPRVGFQFVPALHDDGEKQFLGQRGNLNGTDIIDILVRHPKTAELLCAKLFRFFAYEQPEPAVLRALVRTYFDSGYQVGAVVRQILLSEAFISPKAVRTMVKSPVDYVIGTLRCVGIGQQVTLALQAQTVTPAVLALLRGADIAMQRMGMSLFYPPSVKGWDWGKAWITSATMTERLRFAENLANPGTLGRAVLPALQTRFEELSDEQLLERLSALLDASLSDETRRAILRTVQKTPADRDSKLSTMLRLTCASADYQFM